MTITFAGSDLAGLAVDLPAASVRLLLPSPGSDELVMPAWNGNEFLLPDGRRPAIRTLTPLRFDAEALELDLDFVVHGSGVASNWAEGATVGDPACISGPGRGYVVDAEATTFLVGGDEAAIPAIGQLLPLLPAAAAVQTYIEVSGPEARRPLPGHSGATVVEWSDLPPGSPPGETLFAAVREAKLEPGTRVWVAGEAAAMQRIRRHLFEDRQLPRAHATVRGYWKLGRSGADDEI